MSNPVPYDAPIPPQIEDFGEDQLAVKDYEIAHLKWSLEIAQQTSANRLEEIYKLRRELYG